MITEPTPECERPYFVRFTNLLEKFIIAKATYDATTKERLSYYSRPALETMHDVLNQLESDSEHIGVKPYYHLTPSHLRIIIHLIISCGDRSLMFFQKYFLKLCEALHHVEKLVECENPYFHQRKLLIKI